MWGESTAFLIDMEGNEVHRWELPYPAGDYARLLPNGNLFFNAKTPLAPGTFFPPFGLFKGGAMFEIDWDGNIVWEHRDDSHHHDGRRTESGGAIYLTLVEVPADLVPKIRGGQPGTEFEGRMWADRIREVDADGNVTWEWNVHEHLDPEKDAILESDLRNEWTHGNTVVPLPGGDVMVSFRAISTVARIDRATGDFAWRLGPPLLSQQHDPSLLENGNVLIFNNGTHRVHPLVFSNVIEVEPETGKVVWDYRDPTSLGSFFSTYISGAQRLPNGNTLICEGVPGRIFEVTPQAELVWEYINPHFAEVPTMAFGHNNSVFRAFRYGWDDLRSMYGSVPSGYAGSRDELIASFSNPEAVTSALGSWPSFHDAEVVGVELRRDDYVPSAKLDIETIGFPGGPSEKAHLTLFFKELSDVRLFELNEQNVINDLTVARSGERHTLLFHGTYGLEGGFSYSEAEALSAERIEQDD